MQFIPPTDMTMGGVSFSQMISNAQGQRKHPSIHLEIFLYDVSQSHLN